MVIGLSVCLSVCASVRLSGPTSTSFVWFPPNFVELKIMMCELCSIKDFIVHWVLLLLCLFELRNFETIQYALCHHKFSYMINQKFMKLCTLQDSNMKMCTLVGYPGASSFPSSTSSYQCGTPASSSTSSYQCGTPASSSTSSYQCGTPASSSTSSYQWGTPVSSSPSSYNRFLQLFFYILLMLFYMKLKYLP